MNTQYHRVLYSGLVFYILLSNELSSILISLALLWMMPFYKNIYSPMKYGGSVQKLVMQSRNAKSIIFSFHPSPPPPPFPLFAFIPVIQGVHKYCVFQRILKSLPPLPRHSAVIGCTKNYQPIGVTVHSYCIESFEGLLQRCRQGRGCSELW